MSTRRLLAGLTALAAVAAGITPAAPAIAEPAASEAAFLVAPIPYASTHLTSAQGAYDAARGRHLLAMVAHPTRDPVTDVFVPWSILTQIVGADGHPVAGTNARVNLVQALHDQPYHPSFFQGYHDVAFNPATDEYLLIWSQSTGPNSAAAQGARWGLVYTQRISAATGAPIGSPVQVTAPRGTTAWCSVYDPTVEYNPADGGYLVAWTYGLANGSGNTPECSGLPDNEAYQLEVARLSGAGTLAGSPVTVPGSGSVHLDLYATLARHPQTGEFLLAYRYTKRTDTGTQFTAIRRVSPSGELIGNAVLPDPQLQRASAWAAARPDGNWLVLGYVIGGAVKAYVFTPGLERIGPRVDVAGLSGVTELTSLGDGTFVARDADQGALVQVGPTGVALGARLSLPDGDTVLVGPPGAPAISAGRGSGGDLKNTMTARLVTFGPGQPVTGGGMVRASGRVCFAVTGAPGDVALVNLTPVEASAPGFGQLVSSDVAEPPVASNVNYAPGSFDPNVAAAPIGTDGKVCYVNGPTASVHLVADHLGTIDDSAITLATASGAPERKADTRGGPAVDASGRVCFAVTGAPGDVALVNLTPVEASAPGFGQLVSSDVAEPPVASNVNYAPGSFDPNVAAAPIGTDGKVCYVNGPTASVHLVADHLGTIDGSAITLATPLGAPLRTADTRGGAAVAPSGRVCVGVSGAPGDVALVNLTPVEASAPGFGQLVSSDVAEPPVASNVNYAPGSFDPNVAAAPIGTDGKVCYVNGPTASVHLVADHLATVTGSVVRRATGTGAPSRRIDTRGATGGVSITTG